MRLASGVRDVKELCFAALRFTPWRLVRQHMQPIKACFGGQRCAWHSSRLHRCKEVAKPRSAPQHARTALVKEVGATQMCMHRSLCSCKQADT